MLERFLEDIEASEATKTTYRRLLSGFERFLNGREPSIELCREYLRKLRATHSPRTVATCGYALRRYLKYLGKDGEIEFPSLDVGPPGEFLEEEEVKRLFEHARSPLERALIALLYDSACRIGEILGLRVEDVDWEGGVLRVRRKGRKTRLEEVAIFPSTLELLKEYKNWRGIEEGPLFPYSYQELRKWLKQVADSCGVVFPQGSLFHALRHARARSLRLKGVGLEDISDHLAHTSLTTTLKIYGRITPQKLRERLKAPPW